MANAIIIEPLPFVILEAESAAGYAAANLANDYAGVVWQSPAGATRILKVDLGSDKPFDTVMLFGLWGNIPGGSVNVAYATNAQGPTFAGLSIDHGDPETVGSYYYYGVGLDVFAGSPAISEGNGVSLWREPGHFPPVARYVFVYFYGLGGAGYIRASRLVIGKAIVLERNFGLGGKFGVRDLGSLEYSPRGVMMRRRGRKMRTASISFNSIYRDEVEAKTGPLIERLGNTEMVALVSNPEPHADRQRKCYFGALVGETAHAQRRANGWELPFNMASIF